MSLEDQARQQLDAEHRARAAERRNSEHATLSDVPQLEEFVQLLRKYRVEPINFYQEVKRGNTLLGLGTSFTEYKPCARGWTIVVIDQTDGVYAKVHLVITEDERLYEGYAHTNKSDAWGIIRGVAQYDTFPYTSDRGFVTLGSRINFGQAQWLFRFDTDLLQRAAAMILDGHREGSFVLS